MCDKIPLMKKASLASIMVLIGISIPAFFAQALTISPARLEVSGDPGTTISGEFLLINEQEATKTFYSSVENFQAQGETGTPTFVPGKDGLASWIRVIPEVSLSKGQQQKVSFTIAIPKDADPGGHFAAIFLSTAPTGNGAGQVSVGAKVGILVLLRVSGDIKEGGGISSFTTSSGGFFYSTLPIGFSYRFNNTGNDRVRPDGNLVMRDTIGLKAAEIPANDSKGNVLPSSVRRFEVNWGPDAPAPSGFFAKAGYQWKHFAFGFYSASLDLSYGSASAAHSKIHLFVFPWQLLLIIAIILTGLAFGFAKGLKRYNRWIISKARGI